MNTNAISQEQKLAFLENLLEKNSKIRLQYEQYFSSTKHLEHSLQENDLVILVDKIFNEFESIDTSYILEDNYYCHNSYHDFFDEKHEEILEDIFSPYESIISSSIGKAQLYNAVFQIAAIYKAILKEPKIQDDEYYIFNDEFDVHVEDYISYTLISNLNKSLDEVLICEEENLKSLHFLINLSKEDEKFQLDIFIPLLQNIISNANIALACKESIEFFPSLTQLHIFALLGDDKNYIAYAKKAYQQDREVATLLLKKLHELGSYDKYVLIAQELMKQYPQLFASTILHVVEFSKTPELYKIALQERCFDSKNLQEYTQLKEYLNDDEMKQFRQRVQKSHQELFYIKILEYEKMYEEILHIAQSREYNIEITEVIAPIKNIYPEDVLLLVIEFCDKELVSHGRSRSTYQRMAQALHVIYDVDSIHKSLQEYIDQKLYNHTPRLPALRDELSKAKLV